MSDQAFNKSDAERVRNTDVVADTPICEEEAFEKPFWKMEGKLISKEIWDFQVSGLSCALNIACNLIVVFINFIHIGQLRDPLMQASFGQGFSYYMLFYNGLNIACEEVTGIECGKYFGLKIKNDKDLEEGKITFLDWEAYNEVIIKNYNSTLGKGFVLAFIILAFSILLFLFAEPVLYAINVAPENAYWTGFMVYYQIPGIILQTINFQFQAFVLAQGITKPIGAANVVSVIICAFISGWLVKNLEFGILVFPVCKVVMEICNMVGLAVCYTCIDKETVRCVKFSDITSGLGPFLLLGFKFVLGQYAEFIGFEMNTWIASLTHDQDQISAFVAFLNISGFLFAVGLGFAIAARTRVSNLMGSQDAVKTKNAAHFYKFLSFCVGFIFFILMLSFRHQISEIYSPLPQIKDIIATLLIYHAFGAICEVVLGTQNNLMRLTDRAMTMAYIMLALYVVTLGTMSYLLGFVFGMLVPGMVLAFVIVQLITNIIFFYLINFKTDWEECINIMIENQEKAEKSNIIMVRKASTEMVRKASTEIERKASTSQHNSPYNREKSFNNRRNSELEMKLIT